MKRLKSFMFLILVGFVSILVQNRVMADIYIVRYEGMVFVADISYGVDGDDTAVIRMPYLDDTSEENCTVATIPAYVDSVPVTGIDCHFSDNVKTVNIPNTVKAVELSGDGIEQLSLPDSVETIGEIHCDNLRNIRLSNNLKRIGYEAFVNCAFTSITIPKSVWEIDTEAIGYRYKRARNQVIMGNEKIPGFTIHGYYGSKAEKYAKENGFKFVGNLKVV